MQEKIRRRESPAGFHYYSLYTECPRKHYIKYYLGLMPEKTAKALIFGGAMHEAQAVYYSNWEEHPDILIGMACDKFEHETQLRLQEYSSSDDFEKDLIKGPLLLREHHRTWYAYDKKRFDVVEVEKQRDLRIGPNNDFLLTVRPDRVLENKETGRKIIVDTKTTGYSIDRAFQGADAQDQITSYLWALRQAEPDWNIGEAYIDVLFVRESRSQDPKKVFTAPRAERPGTIYRSKEALDQFELGMFGIIMEVSQKYENLPDFHEEILFPRNGKNCMMFGCEYSDFCRQHLNKDYLPQGFVRDPWLLKQKPQKPKET